MAANNHSTPHPHLESDILSPRECEQLLRACARSRHTCTVDDCLAVLRWAEETRLRFACLSLALEGKIALCVKDGEVRFEGISDV